jgi:hypothetical protein
MKQNTMARSQDIRLTMIETERRSDRFLLRSGVIMGYYGLLLAVCGANALILTQDKRNSGL